MSAGYIYEISLSVTFCVLVEEQLFFSVLFMTSLNLRAKARPPPRLSCDDEC